MKGGGGEGNLGSGDGLRDKMIHEAGGDGSEGGRWIREEMDQEGRGRPIWSEGVGGDGAGGERGDL